MEKFRCIIRVKLCIYYVEGLLLLAREYELSGWIEKFIIAQM